MEENSNIPRHPTNWSVRFLCDCKKHDKEFSIHHGIAHEISTQAVHLLSDHHICPQKKVAMHLMIPSLHSDTPNNIVKIIGHSIDTVANEGKFLTEIAFLHFEEDGLQELKRNLRQRFDTPFLTPATQRA